MFPEEICYTRLFNQQVSAQRFSRPKDVVAWMGAMQAQDFSMSRWAVALRVPGADVNSVQASIDRGDIIRTHVLRPTWHLAPASEISWMLDLSAPQIKRVAMLRLKELEVTTRQLSKSLKVLEQALSGGNHLTREELLTELRRNKISTDGQRAAHILVWAEVEKMICSGKRKGNKNTYALFDERVKVQKKLSKEEALAELAARYFRSHGPATLDDFTNWSALPKTQARTGLELVRKKLVEIDGYWMESVPNVPINDPSVHLLPAFDEFLIGYKDRSATLARKSTSVVITVNGIFWPIIVTNGVVTGRWKRTVKGTKVTVELEYFPRTPIRNNPHIKKLTIEAIDKVRNFFAVTDRS